MKTLRLGILRVFTCLSNLFQYRFDFEGFSWGQNDTLKFVTGATFFFERWLNQYAVSDFLQPKGEQLREKRFWNGDKSNVASVHVIGAPITPLHVAPCACRVHCPS